MCHLSFVCLGTWFSIWAVPSGWFKDSVAAEGGSLSDYWSSDLGFVSYSSLSLWPSQFYPLEEISQMLLAEKKYQILSFLSISVSVKRWKSKCESTVWQLAIFFQLMIIEIFLMIGNGSNSIPVARTISLVLNSLTCNRYSV